MRWNGFLRWIVPSIICSAWLAIPSGAFAAQSGPGAGDWPGATAWKKLYCGANPATDLVADGNGTVEEKDLVGDTSRPAAYYFTSTDYLFMRLRLEGPVNQNATKLRPFSWSFGFDTVGNRTAYDWVWSVNGGSGAGQDVMKMYWIASGGGPNSMTPTEVSGSGYPAGGYSLGIGGANAWARYYTTVSSFDGSGDDSFLDIAVPLQDFASISAAVGPGVSKMAFSSGVITMWGASATTGGKLNKDFLCWDDSQGEPNLAAIAPQPIGIGVTGYGVFTYPANQSTIYTTTPVITGTANPSSTFTITDGSHPVSVASDAAGNWSYPASAGWGWHIGDTITMTLTSAGWATTSTTFTIACPAGTQAAGDFLSCIDIDECSTITPNGGCSSDAACTNASPGRTCACNAGFIGDGIVCVAAVSSTVTITSPANGSQFTTVTPTVSGTATPSTVVTLSYGSNSTTITSDGAGNWTFSVPLSWGLVYGSPSVTFIASVPSGATSSTTVSIVCAPGYTAAGQSCTDNDECAESNGGCDVNATCTDQAGQAPTCTCNGGYFGNGIECTSGAGSPAVDKVFIVDPADGSNLSTTAPTVTDNETINSATDSTPSITFTLTDGTSSNAALTTDGSGLWSYSIPSSWNWRYGTNVMLTATVASGQSSRVLYYIPCPTGFQPDSGGGSCVDINECSLTASPCLSGQTCHNTNGSYFCVAAPVATPTPTPDPTQDSLGPDTTEMLGPDTDGDGIPDSRDNCKYIKNPAQESSATESIGAACDFGDNNAAEDREAAGMKAAGSGCTMKIGGNNGLGTFLFGSLFWFGFRRARRRLRPGFTKALKRLLPLLALGLVVAESDSAQASEGGLDVEQFDAIVPGAGALNQSYGRIDAVDSRWIFGLGVQYSQQPLRLIRAVPEDPRQEGDVIPALLRWEFLARHVLGSWSDIQIAVPYVSTLGDPDWTIGGRTEEELKGSSLGDARVSVGVDLLRLYRGVLERRPGGFGLALRTTMWIPVGGEKTVLALHGEESARYEPRLIADYINDAGFHFGLGVGYHVRKKSQIMHVVNGSAYRWGAFVSGPLWKNSKWVGTAFGAEQIAKQIDPQDPENDMPPNVFSPREVMGGVITDHGKLISTFAMGVGINGAVGSPKRRYLAQIAYSLDEIKMRDSVVDRKERKEEEKKQQAAPVAICPKGEVCERELVASILFLTGSSHIRIEEAAKVRDTLAQIKPGEEVASVEIAGRTDNVGSKQYNEALSWRRADSAKELLASTGIPLRVMKSVAYGFEKPVADNKDDAGKQKNRQVDIRIKLFRRK